MATARMTRWCDSSSVTWRKALTTANPSESSRRMGAFEIGRAQPCGSVFSRYALIHRTRTHVVCDARVESGTHGSRLGNCRPDQAARHSPQQSRVVRYPEIPLKQNLKTFVTLAAVAVLIVVSGWIGLLIWGRLAGPTVDERGIVTVVAHVHGNVGKNGGHYRHLVRTASGAEYRMTFGEMYPVGSRLSVTYRRFSRGDTIQVFFYSRVPE